MRTDKTMTCHECGSEVAENDVFCPFCGISLEPVSLADDQIDDSMASTIMIQPSEVDALTKAAKAESRSGVSDNERDNSEASSIKETNAEPLPDQEPESEIADIPAPMILGGPGKTLDNLAATSTSEFNLAEDASDGPGATEEGPAVLAEELPGFANLPEEPGQSQPADEPVSAQPVETATVATNAEPPSTEDSRTDFAES
ncbi:MAG: zinc ribbon domain-containing protein, partial [Pyrinomonadaceae bacterium]